METAKNEVDKATSFWSTKVFGNVAEISEYPPISLATSLDSTIDGF